MPQETIYLKDYKPSAFLIDEVALRFTIHPDHTLVESTLQIKRNPNAEHTADLVLDGEELGFIGASIDGDTIGAERIHIDHDHLRISDMPDACELRISTRIHPDKNTALEGLYLSAGNYMTQCEAQGFRKITYYLDRPDVMARFSTTIEADKEQFPILLSNGNPVAQGDTDGGRHWVCWEDPFPKPSYLFALVAGNLAVKHDVYTTGSGRAIQLRFYTEHKNIEKCDYAIGSLKRAMLWDEKTYGREYDLDIYMVVATDDFNMGAMENKGLNIFNSKYVLATPETATDADYEGIEGVIAHEYFHNWTGNRVTCRDWFQLSLKEGLTVFRDQEFSADMTSRAVKRISDVNALRVSQFAEDAGPMAHPVRPDSYQEINNFYTVTVYEKGAEVVRMYRTLLGADGFRKGTDLYFDRHDGQAVTTDDFAQAMQDANDFDLTQFKRWYSQSGTPLVAVQSSYDAEAKTYTLTFTQSCPATPGQNDKQPFYMPVEIALFTSSGTALSLNDGGDTETVLNLSQDMQSFVFSNIDEVPIPSLLRGFSAPVKLEYDYTDDELAVLLSHDTDSFNRWEASQLLAMRVLRGLISDYQRSKPLDPSHATGLIQGYRQLLTAPNRDNALLAKALILPAENYIGDQMLPIDIEAIHQSRIALRKLLAAELETELMAIYEELSKLEGKYKPDPNDVGQRALKNICLSYLMELDKTNILALCWQQFNQAQNMTDALGALAPLANTDCTERQKALDQFYDRWQNDALVTDKWFAMQASSRLPNTLGAVKDLMQHDAFKITNPNKVRSLVAAFAYNNPNGFHHADGSGYQFVADRIIQLNDINPQIAARLSNAFARWKRLEPVRSELMRVELERIKAHPDLSSDVTEIINKTLAA